MTQADFRESLDAVLTTKLSDHLSLEELQDLSAAIIKRVDTDWGFEEDMDFGEDSSDKGMPRSRDSSSFSLESTDDED